jgi:hypothetical protein
MRGRLIAPMTVEIARLNTAATAAASAYDDDFKTMKPGAARVEHATVRLKAQVEMGAWQGMVQTQAGNVPDSRLTLVFHMRELEAAGLVDPTNGGPLLRVNDRLVAIYDRAGARLEQYVSASTGGLYATKVEPAGIGLGGRVNLVVAVFEDRAVGLTSNP